MAVTWNAISDTAVTVALQKFTAVIPLYVFVDIVRLYCISNSQSNASLPRSVNRLIAWLIPFKYCTENLPLVRDAFSSFFSLTSIGVLLAVNRRQSRLIDFSHAPPLEFSGNFMLPSGSSGTLKVTSVIFVYLLSSVIVVYPVLNHTTLIIRSISFSEAFEAFLLSIDSWQNRAGACFENRIIPEHPLSLSKMHFSKPALCMYSSRYKRRVCTEIYTKKEDSFPMLVLQFSAKPAHSR